MQFTAVCKICECVKTGNLWTGIKINETNNVFSSEDLTALYSKNETCPHCKNAKKAEEEKNIPLEYFIVQVNAGKKEKEDNRPLAILNQIKT